MNDMQPASLSARLVQHHYATADSAPSEGTFARCAGPGTAGIPPLEPQDYRAIMRSLASGVTVITTSREGRPHGMTATAFSSVCADPPTVLVVLNKSTRTHPMLRAARRFAVHLLAEHQVELSQRFSGKHDAPFDGVAHGLSPHGLPLLSDVLATLECETVQEMDVGTHTIFVGQVLRGAASDRPPLIYHDGCYKSVRT